MLSLSFRPVPACAALLLPISCASGEGRVAAEPVPAAATATPAVRASAGSAPAVTPHGVPADAAAVDAVSNSNAGSLVPPEEAPEPLPAKTTVLHIGDSFAGALGIALNAELKKAGVRGVLQYKTASFIPNWAWGKDLPLYLAQYKPDLVLISLGANEVAIFNPEQRAGLIKKLVARLDGRPCVWIAPPLWAGDTGLLPVIRKNCAPCRFMDSSAIFPGMPRLKDKIHPTIPAREDWAKRVVAWLARERRPTPEQPWALAPEAGAR